MSHILLIKPSMDYHDSFVEAIHALKEDQRAGFRNVGGIELEPQGVAQYIEDCAYYEKGEHLPQGWVPSTTYWLVDTDAGDVLGTINVRHALNEFLENYGGHIGYAIVPAHRRLGYGSLLLKLTLQRVQKDTGLTRVLLTCDEDNIASQKIIEKNRGVYEDKRQLPESGKWKLRYWISC